MVYSETVTQAAEVKKVTWELGKALDSQPRPLEFIQGQCGAIEGCREGWQSSQLGWPHRGLGDQGRSSCNRTGEMIRADGGREEGAPTRLP